jgi:hypothetical protein
VIVLRDAAGTAERAEILEMLRTICPEGDVDVNLEGSVFLRDSAPCADPENTGGECLCALIAFADRTVSIRLNRDLKRRYGGGITLVPPLAPGSPAGMKRMDPATLQPDGSRGPGISPSVEIEGGDHHVAALADDPRTYVPEPDWLILAHELCGHALHMMRGDEQRADPQDPPVLPYPENHRQATAAGAAIREAHGLPAIDQESVRRREGVGA